MNPIRNFIIGFKAPFFAVPFIVKNPKVTTLIIIPLAINIALYTLFFYFGSSWIQNKLEIWNSTISQTLPTWLDWLSPTLALISKIIAWILLLISAALSFTIVSGIIASPFSDHLSYQTEKSLTKKSTAQQLSTVDVIKLETKRTMVLILGAIIAFILGVTPLIHFLGVILGSLLLSFEYFGYPISRESKKLSTVWFFVIRNIFLSMGFGMSLLLLMAIPLASIFYIPLAVVSGTMLKIKVSRPT